MAEAKKQPSSFQSSQPKIPGVPQRAAETAGENPPDATDFREFLRSPYLLAGGGGAILLLVIALVWWAHAATRARVSVSNVANNHVAAASQPEKPAEAPPVAPGPIATVAEMKPAWSTKAFVYRESKDSTVPGLLVHLPGDTYWAISLREPFGNCELEFASVEKLQSDYNLNAPYPMIGNPCTHTVYDLTRYGDGPNGLVRGAAVAGAAIRPPLAIEVEVKAGKIVAKQEEAIAPTQ